MEKANEKNAELSGLKGILLGRRIPEPAVAVLLYFAYCFAYWQSVRISLATAVISYPGVETVRSIMGNELAAFLLAGIMPYLVTELLSGMAIRQMAMLGADPVLFRYLFRIFYGLGLVAAGAAGLLCFAFPYLVLLYSTVARFVILTVFAGLYLWFACRYCVPPHLRGRTVFVLGRVYLVANMILCFAEIIVLVI